MVVLFNRMGKAVATYPKIYPTLDEMEAGIRPGGEPAVVDTKVGRVTCAICNDLKFAHIAAEAAQGHAQLLLWPSWYEGGLAAVIWAKMAGWYFIGASNMPGAPIVDPMGRILAVGQRHQPIQTVRVNLDYVLLHNDLNKNRFDDVRSRYGPRVRLEVDTETNHTMLVAEAQDLSAGQVVEKMSLEPLAEYFQRIQYMRREILERS